MRHGGDTNDALMCVIHFYFGGEQNSVTAWETAVTKNGALCFHFPNSQLLCCYTDALPRQKSSPTQ